MKRSRLLCLFSGVLLHGLAEGRPVAIPAIDRLWEGASLIAIVRYEKTIVTDRQMPEGQYETGTVGGERMYREAASIFSVHAVLKLDPKMSDGKRLEKLRIRHYVVASGKPEFNGGFGAYFLPSDPGFSVYPRHDIEKGPVEVYALGSGDYLAFLRLADDGVIEPFTGGYDAAPSFFVLSRLQPNHRAALKYFEHESLTR